MPASGFSIGELSEQTGVKPVTLRAWERRYGLLRPGRSDSGHRIYSPSDVSRVRQVVSWLQQGVAIGQVPSLLHGSGRARPAAPPGPAAEIVDSALRFRQQKLDQQLGRCLVEQPLAVFARDILVPVRSRLRDIGGDSATALALLDGVLQHKLGALVLKHSRRVRRQAAWLVVAAGGHESRLMALLYSVALLEAGAEVLHVPRLVTGPGLAALVESQRAGGVLLVACPGTRPGEWRRLVSAGADQGQWLVAGHAATLPLAAHMRGLDGGPGEVIDALGREGTQ
ncbi:MAG: MerR family transcriptional regulator [Alcanivoracaceae bacterium]|jgi:DNA-binding transcriptional MerR regulator|nr:MerR family transcriptional regulator [Alcanivoracaceae bacterium]